CGALSICRYFASVIPIKSQPGVCGQVDMDIKISSHSGARRREKVPCISRTEFYLGIVHLFIVAASSATTERNIEIILCKNFTGRIFNCTAQNAGATILYISHKTKAIPVFGIKIYG